MKQSVQYIPLTFINAADDIAYQIKNTVVFSYLLNLYPETSLGSYLDSSQYGFTASAMDSGSHRLLRITDINNGVVDWNSVPYCECDAEEKYLLKKRDILIARTGGTTGKSFLVEDVPTNAVFASYLIRLRVKGEHEVHFINAFLNSYVFWSQIVEMKSGSAQPNVNAEKLKELRLPDCSINVQEEIVRLLRGESTEGGLADLQRLVVSTLKKFRTVMTLADEIILQVNLVEQLRKSILVEAVQGKLVPQDVNEEPASELLKRIVAEKEKLVIKGKQKQEKTFRPITQEEIPFVLPERWVWCRLGDISDIVRGSSPRPKGDPKYFSQVRTDYPFIKIYDITNHSEGDTLIDTSEFLTKEGSKFGRRVDKGDIIIAVSGSGSVGKVSKLGIDGFIYDGLIAMKDIPVAIKPYIFAYLKTQSSSLIGSATGTSWVNLNTDLMKSLLIPLPPLNECIAIVSKIEELNNTAKQLQISVEQSMNEAQRLLEAILREAFNHQAIEYQLEETLSIAEEQS